MNLESQIVQALGGLLSTAVIAGIGVITPKIKSFLTSHTTAKTAAVANNALDGLTKIVESVVADFNQRIVNDSKSKQAWTPELAMQVKNDAVIAVKNQGTSFINLINGDVEALISTLVEQAVVNQKGAASK